MDMDNGDFVEINASVAEQLGQETEEIQRAVFKLLIEEEASEVLKYNALRALIKQLLTPPSEVDKAILLDLVNEALVLTKILSKKYDLYINEHAGFLSKGTLQNHQKSYQSWIDSTVPVPLVRKDRTWMDWFMTEFTTERMNPRRLYVLRERRLLVLLVPIIKNFGNYSSWILWADAYVAPFLIYLGAVFFLPRLIFNLCTLSDNTFDEGKMRTEAKKLDSWIRFKAQWNRLWPQIMNDVGWGLSGALMCFVFIGSWQPLAIYLSVGMQFYDVLMVSIRMYFDFNRLYKLTEQYDNLPLDPNFPLDEKYKELHQAYCRHLKTGIQREKTLLYLALTNASVLFLALCLSLPFMVALNPLLPIVGSVIAIMMTIINFQGRSYLNTPESKTLEHLLEENTRLTPVTPCSARDAEISTPESQQDILQEITSNAPPSPIRSQSYGHPIGFFSINIIAKAPSYQALMELSGSPSPTGIMRSFSISCASGDTGIKIKNI